MLNAGTCEDYTIRVPNCNTTPTQTTHTHKYHPSDNKQNIQKHTRNQQYQQQMQEA